jgi:hypothetical protein
MSQSFSVRPLQPLVMSNASPGVTVMTRIANWFRIASSQRDLIAVVGFCAIGLVITFAVIAHLPDFSAINVTP